MKMQVASSPRMNGIVLSPPSSFFFVFSLFSSTPSSAMFLSISASGFKFEFKLPENGLFVGNRSCSVA